jgi:general secretion pathway protein M
MTTTANRKNSAPGAARQQFDALRSSAQARWQSFNERERIALAVGTAALLLLLIWAVLLAPALRTLNQAPTQLAQLDAQLQEMRRLADESRALRAQPPVPGAQAAQALQAASERLGDAAGLTITGERAVLNLKHVSPEALQAWLGEVRSAARARPVEAALQRGTDGFYSGSIVLSLGSGGA